MFIFFFEALLSFFLLLFLGRFILSFTNFRSNSDHFNYFVQLFTGFFGAITIFSIAKTMGITISSLLLTWVLIWLVSSKKINKPTFLNFFNLNKKNILEYFTILILLVIFNYFKYYNSSSSIPIVNNWDALSDVTRAVFLNYTGIENTNTNFIQLPSGSQPYHYFEAWAVAFFASLFKGNYWISQNLLFQPIILTLIYVGFRALATKISSNKISVFFGISLFFASGVINDSLLKIPFFEWCIPLKNNIIDEPWWTRMSVLYPIIQLALYFILESKWKHGIFALLLIPFISVTPAIPIISSTFAIIFICFLFNKLNKKTAKLLLIPVLSAFFYQGFYFVFKDTSEFISLPTLSEILKEISTSSVIKSKIIIIIEKIIQTIILYSPYILLIGICSIILKKKLIPNKWNLQDKIILLYILLIMLISLIMWQVLNFIFGASFFYYYTMIPIFNIVLTFVLFKLFIEQSKIIQISSILLLSCLMIFYINRSFSIHNKISTSYFTERYSTKFLEKVQYTWNKKINQKDLALGVKFEDHAEIIHPFFNDGLSLCGYYLYGIANAPALLSLSRGDMPEEKLKETLHSENFTKHTSFYQYVNLKKNEKEKNINLLKKKFILEYNIKFGTVTPNGTIPMELNDIIDSIFTDDLSGEKFILFKN